MSGGDPTAQQPLGKPGVDPRVRPEEIPGTGLANPVIEFLVALQFLTISPAFIKRIFTPLELGRATAFFPVVGAVVGGLILAANELLWPVFPQTVRAALVLALWVLLTGALHLDGFLDTCDGLLGGFTPESRLQIMRDERVGGYALAGGVLLLLLKFTALGALPARPAALLLAPILGRWGMVVAIAAFPYARPEGLGKAMKDHTTWRQVGLATLLALAAVWLVAGWLGLAAAGLAALVVWAGARFSLRRIPGLTGDIYGALNELVELTVLLFFLI